MAPLPDSKIQAIALHALVTLEAHLSSWPELEAYASGAVALVACITQNLELSIHGVYSSDSAVREGEFLRVDFGNYWVFNPGMKLSPIEYRCRMTAWLEKARLDVYQRANLQHALVGLCSSPVDAFQPFTALLLRDTATAVSIRHDLIDMLPGLDQVAVKLEHVLKQFPKKDRLTQWMAPFRFKRQ